MNRFAIEFAEQLALCKNGSYTICYTGSEVRVAIKVKAKEMKTTIYQVRNKLFAEYLKSQLQHPTIPAL